MYSIGQLSKHFNISRSTLIYYDEINLLKPTTRSDKNYRLYDDETFHRLEQIITYKNLGLSLEHILKILENDKSESESILESHLNEMNLEISRIREKQHVLLKLMESKAIKQPEKSMTKNQWVHILQSAGLTDDDMSNWHIEFEKNRPEAHQDFLESLGLTKDEVKHIRAISI